jgi:hypothetical protein
MIYSIFFSPTFFPHFAFTNFHPNKTNQQFSNQSRRVKARKRMRKEYEPILHKNHKTFLIKKNKLFGFFRLVSTGKKYGTNLATFTGLINFDCTSFA